MSIKLLNIDETLFALFGFAAFFLDFTSITNKMEILPPSMNLQLVVFSGIKACNHLDNRSQIYMFNKPVCSKYFLH